MSKDRFAIGPTGKFPDGKIWPCDHGEIAVGIGIDPVHKIVVMQFGVPTRYIGMLPEQAIEIADDLINKANTLTEAEVEVKETNDP